MKQKLFAALLCLLMMSCAIPGVSALAEDVPVLSVTLEETVSLPDAGPDNDAMFQQYIGRLLPGVGSAPRLRALRGSAGDRLTGMNRQLYDLLLPLVENVANGQRTSTIFEFTATDMGFGMYTAADLGLDSLLDETNTFTQEATSAVMAKDAFETGAAVTALTNDRPYHLYWFDKVYNHPEEQDGFAIRTQYGFTYDYNAQNELRLGMSGITVKLRVAEAYQAGSPFTVNATLPQRVQTASATISSIVAANTGAGDRQKLEAYKSWICQNVDYNHAAADDDSTPYGDPWQLIYVFDNDPSTKVVCEGYSKAFKYLCDRSTFEGDIRCILATGQMAGGTGAGPHMWDIVKMPNGLNYMMDVTNIDSGNPGLNLSGYTAHPSTNSYRYEGLSYTYDGETLSSWDYETWLNMSDTAYEEVPVAITFASEGQGAMAADSVICGYPYTLPDNGFTPPKWHTFAGWTIDGDPSGTVYQPGDKPRVMTDTVWRTAWTTDYPAMSTPDFTLPAHIQTIDSEAFRGIKAQVVSIPASNASQRIEDYAFASCASLREIHIPASVTSIGAHAFDQCPSDLIIFGATGSAAETFAAEHNILFVPVAD